jgi:phosphate acetyltransferase
MASSIYISTTEAGSGKALISLGILELILRKTSRVGFFRPIIRPHKNHSQKDEDIDLILTHFNLPQAYEESFGLSYREASDLISHKQYDVVLEKIIESYKNLEKNCDFILCEGSDYLKEGSAFEFDLNQAISKNLSCPILILGNAESRTIEEAILPIEMAIESYQGQDCKIIGVILNKASPQSVLELRTSLEQELSSYDYLLSVIPYYRKLSSPSLEEIADQLNAKVLYGHDKINTLVPDYVIAAMQLPNVITRLKDDCLVITPGDRADIIIGCLQAHQSSNYPNLSGLLLSTSAPIDTSILKLIDGLTDPIPVLSVDTNTYETSQAVNQVHTSLKAKNTDKIQFSLKLFDDYVDLDQLEAKISTIKVQGITPKMFTYNLVQTAKSQQRHIVLPEGYDPRILKAASVLIDRQIVKLTLLGKIHEIEQILSQNRIDIDLNQLNIIDPESSKKFEAYAQQFYEVRKHKGMTLEAAREYLLDVSYFGTMMVYNGDADGMVSGAMHTTQHTIRPALQIIKTKPDFSVVSSVFFMCLSDRVLVYGDCAVNPNPNPEQLAEIAIASAETAQIFGIEPRVALLSYSSGDSGKGEEVEKVRTATQIAKQRRPDLKLEGPIQYDAAVDAAVATQKMPGSEVAGQTTVFIFPDLNTGNNTYKAVQRETGAIAIGPILQGLKKPVNDLSRGCTVEDIINTVVITAIQTQGIQ